MANLAIKGHATRGKEIIEILEMLGGKNLTKLIKGNTIDHVYIINSSYYGEIDCLDATDGYNVFTLEQFLEKFPYKVGDKVIYNDSPMTITKMVWENQTNTVAYKLDDKLYCNVIKELQPYTKQKEIMEMNIVNNDCNKLAINTTTDLCDNKVITFANCNLDVVELDLADKFEIVLKEGKYYAVKKQPQYPKTYEECCKLLNKTPFITFNGISLNEIERYKPFIMLCRCRDAYWKIAGDWMPDWSDSEYPKYTIRTVRNIVHIDEEYYSNRVLAFPTEEMRDAFYENFKELINQCKELL